jgi:hypothetical protein
MAWLKELFGHRGNETLVREQVSFFIRDAQNKSVEMGKLLQQAADSGQPALQQHSLRLLQLNTQVGDTLEQVQRSLK